MDTTTHHTLSDLFDQIGLPSTEADISEFVRQHGPLDDDCHLTQADFWSESQAAFLREQWRADGDWALVVDELNVLLHRHPDMQALDD